jgi:glycosyltransferase involved in cell wall biosynthesis
MTMKKLCYILPEYKKGDATHFSYLHDFIAEAGKRFDLRVIVERGVLPAGGLGAKAAAVLFFGFWGPLRVGELLVRLLSARIKGYKDFYVHYSFFGAMTASIIARLFGGRVFYWNCGEPWKYKRNFLREMFEKRVYKMITYLVTGTETVARSYAEYYDLPMEKIKIMPNWINLKKTLEQKNTRTKKQELSIRDEQKVLLFVHRLSKRKGAHYLPAILDGLRDQDVVLLIAGEGPERKELEQRFTVLGLKDRVKFLGPVPQENIMDYYAIADAFVMPSEEEGFPHVLLEAMAAGVPFVASDVGGVVDMTPSAARSFIVSAGDIPAYIEKINLLLDMPAENRDKLGRGFQDFVTRYDLSAVIKIFEDILRP